MYPGFHRIAVLKVSGLSPYHCSNVSGLSPYRCYTPHCTKHTLLHMEPSILQPNTRSYTYTWTQIDTIYYVIWIHPSLSRAPTESNTCHSHIPQLTSPWQRMPRVIVWRDLIYNVHNVPNRSVQYTCRPTQPIWYIIQESPLATYIYVIHEFQHRFSNHGNIGIIFSMLVSTHVSQTLKYWCDLFKFFKHLNIAVISSKIRDIST